MNAVIDAVRKKYPDYANVDDDSLTRAIGDKYPQYLKDESFAADYSRLIDTDLPPEENVTPEVTEKPLTAESLNIPQLLPGGLNDPGDPREGAFTQALFNEAPAAAMAYVGNVARGAVADVAVGIRTLGETKKEAIKTSVESSGNLPAAIMGETLPIDRTLGEAAMEDAQQGNFPTSATVGQVSQGLAAMAPLAAIGFAPATIQRLAALGFSADMIAHAPELFKDYAEEINKPKEDQDPDKIAKLTSGIMQTFAFAPLAGKHGASGVPAGPLNPRFDKRTGFSPPEAKSPEVVNLEHSNAPLTAKAVEEIQAKPLNPGGALKDLPIELQEKSNADKDAMAAEFAMLKSEQEASNKVDTTKAKKVGSESVSETPNWKSLTSAGDALGMGMRHDNWESPIGQYQVRALAGPNRGKFTVNVKPQSGGGWHVGIFKNITEAKKAAEADFDSRASSAQSPSTPATSGEGKKPKPISPETQGAPGSPSADKPVSQTEASSKVGEQIVPAKITASTQQTLTPAPLTPGTPSPTTPISVKSQRQMITDLSKALKLPIRFGRLTAQQKVGGYFKEIADLIGVRKASDVPATAHEAGHKLDSMFGLSRDPSIAAELDRLGDPSTPGSASSWTASKGAAYKLGEGVGEFVRYWITDPAKAKADAPNTFTAFEKVLDANKDLGDALRQTQEDVKVWREAPAQARLRSQISVGENPNKTRYTASQLTRDLVDDLHILRKATEEAGPLKPTEDPYIAARNLRGSYGMAETFINKGVVDFNSKRVRMGTSLEDALKPVAGRINDFRDWIVAKRAQELHSQGRESGFLKRDIDEVAAKFDGDANFQQAFQDIRAWQDKLLDYATDAGLISKASAEKMRDMNASYVPFHRVFEVGAGESPSSTPMGIGMGLNVGKPGSLKTLKGSLRQVVDPLETMVKNAYVLVTAAEKAAINKSVAALANKPGMGKWVEKVATPKQEVKVELDRIRKELEAAGADLSKVPDDLLLTFYRSSNKTPYGENIIRVIKNGEPEFYRLNKELHDTFQALDLEDSSAIIRILSSPAQLLRAGVTLEPSFSLANAWRDAFSSAILSKHGALPFENAIRGFAAMIGNKKLVAEWAASGGKTAVESAFFDRKKMQEYIQQKITKDLTPAERATVVVKNPLAALRLLSSAVEEATRIGEYQKALNSYVKQGMTRGEARRLAAFESRDRQDFAKGGAKTKIIRHMAPFWNAALQGNVKLAQSFKERPIATTLKGLAYITSLKLAEQALNWNDGDYWDRPQWERDAFFMIPNGKDASGHTKFIRLPIPFLPGVLFATIPGRILQYAKKNDPKAAEGIMSAIAKETVPLPSVPMASAVFENMMTGPQGWDVYRGRPVVPDRLADLPPGLQFTEQTSTAAKKLGELMGVSPMKVDHFIEQTTGGLGKLATGRAMPGQRFKTAPLNVSSQIQEEFYEKLKEAEALQAQGKPAVSGVTVMAGVISTLRKAEREADTDAEKAEIREAIFQAMKEALELDATPK